MSQAEDSRDDEGPGADIPAHVPIGDEIEDWWEPTDDSDIGLIVIPDLAEPVVLEWHGYECPDDAYDTVQYLGRFTYGGEPLVVKERFVYSESWGERTAKYRVRGVSREYAGCTELVEVLAAGQTVPLDVFESGAYRGLWYSDVFHTRPLSGDPEAGVEETACRAIFLLSRSTVLIFRSLYRDRG